MGHNRNGQRPSLILWVTSTRKKLREKTSVSCGGPNHYGVGSTTGIYCLVMANHRVINVVANNTPIFIEIYQARTDRQTIRWG